MKRGKILLLDDDRVTARATRLRLESLEHVLVAVIEQPAEVLSGVDKHAPDLLLINARNVGEPLALKIARHVHKRFDVPSVMQCAVQRDKPRKHVRGSHTNAITRIHDAHQLDAALQVTLYRSSVEREQKRANEETARADQAESAIRSTARLVHQLNNLLSSIRCNAFLMQSATAGDANLSETARDITTAVERSASVMNDLTGLVRDSGPLEPPYAFPVSVPALDDHATAPKRVLHGRASTGVLVVDDDPVVHRALTRFLTSRGYRILAAHTPHEALLIANSEQVAVVITDLIMPEMTGYDLVTRIEKLQPSVEVIYMSGYAGGGSAEITGANVTVGAAAKRAATPLLQKPFDLDDLVRVLSAALKKNVTGADSEGDALHESQSTHLASNDP